MKKKIAVVLTALMVMAMEQQLSLQQVQQPKHLRQLQQRLLLTLTLQ